MISILILIINELKHWTLTNKEILKHTLGFINPKINSSINLEIFFIVSRVEEQQRWDQEWISAAYEH